MIKAFKALFEVDARESDAEREHRIHLAAAALLIETARADFTEDAEEQQTIHALLCNTLQLGASEVEQLIRAADARVDTATSLYEFTRVINDHYEATQKIQLIQAMWRVAYADGNLDKYEEHLIRQVAELTYVAHDEFIRTKLSAREEA